MALPRLTVVLLALAGASALAAPPTLVQTGCGRGANSASGDVTLLADATRGSRLIVAVWWTGTNAQVTSVTDDRGNSWRLLAPPVVSDQGATVFTVALYETVNQADAIPFVIVTMDAIPVSNGLRTIDLTLLEFSGVAEFGAIHTAADAGATAVAGPIETRVSDELIVAYVGGSEAIQSSNDGLMTITTCWEDWSATKVAPTPGVWGGTFTGPSNLGWATVTFALRPTVFDGGLSSIDAGTDAGSSLDSGVDLDGGSERDGGSDQDGGTESPDAGTKRQLIVGCTSAGASPWALALLLLLRRRVSGCRGARELARPPAPLPTE